MTSSLPITPLLPEIIRNLQRHSRLILQAPPGAGKTTSVPLALLDADFLQGRSILMLEPRRLAASNAARYMAGQLGEPVGKTVGYSIRYQRKVSNTTRIEVVTEGILTRRLQQDPELTGVGLVIFDEFHERHLQSDLALALCLDVQQGLREDLRLLLMSATLDGDQLARQLDAPLLVSKGRSYPVAIDYLPGKPQERLVPATVRAVRKALNETAGDLLVFLPGEGEIRSCLQQLSELPDLLLCPLYGSLPFAAQERAIRPAEQRKIVLATNIAETSLTIEGIRVVIDSGYCRQPRFDAGAGLTRLQLSRISQASASQRAGRAGRLGPGHCYRLWSSARQQELLPQTPPEIRVADLAPLALELLAWGISDPAELFWLDPPSPSAWQNGLDLLQRLGALNERHQLTDSGRQLARFPTHPRLGRLLLSAEQNRLLPLGCDLVALLGEADPWRQQNVTRKSDSDLLDRLESFWQRPSQFPAIVRASRYWRRYFNLPEATPPAATAQQLALLLACAYPDRIGKRRQNASTRYLLSSGSGAVLGSSSAVQDAELLIAVELQGTAGKEAKISLASRLDEQTLARLYPNQAWQPRTYWDTEAERVVSVEEQKIGSLVLRQRQAKAQPELVQQELLQAIVREGLQLLPFSRKVESLRNRLQFLHRQLDPQNWPDFSDSTLLATLDEWLLPFLGQASSRNELQQLDLTAALRSRLNWQQLQQLDRLAPERLSVPSGSSIRILYSADKPPVLAVKLQEMFGQTGTPTVAAGRVPLQLHLLSPAGRPLQITQDLEHFWRHSYPEVQKEMKGRYPKHPWPDDPLQALPTAKTKRKLAQQET